MGISWKSITGCRKVVSSVPLGTISSRRACFKQCSLMQCRETLFKTFPWHLVTVPSMLFVAWILQVYSCIACSLGNGSVQSCPSLCIYLHLSDLQMCPTAFVKASLLLICCFWLQEPEEECLRLLRCGLPLTEASVCKNQI